MPPDSEGPDEWLVVGITEEQFPSVTLVHRRLFLGWFFTVQFAPPGPPGATVALKIDQGSGVQPRDALRLTARKLREVPLGELERAAALYWREHMRKLAQHPAVEEDVAAFVARFDAQPRPGRRGRSPYDYAVLAAAYVAALEEGAEDPVRRLAGQMGYSTSRVRGLLHEARHNKGMLTPAARGRAGGELTPKARRLLDGDR